MTGNSHVRFGGGPPQKYRPDGGRQLGGGLPNEGQVIWNAMAPALWHRTWTYFSRELAAIMGMTHKKLLSLVKPRMVKVGEYQRRGAIHFHAIIRLDAAPPADDPEVVAPPPAQFTTEILEKAIRAARDSAVVPCPELAALGDP